MKIYLIEKFDKNKYVTHGYITDRRKAKRLIEKSETIEMKSFFGESFIPKVFVKMYRMIEVQKL